MDEELALQLGSEGRIHDGSLVLAVVDHEKILSWHCLHVHIINRLSKSVTAGQPDAPRKNDYIL